jgi:hypothetical protein
VQAAGVQIAVMPMIHRLDAAGRERVIARIDETLAWRPEVAFATIFGSFVEAGAFRDIDLFEDLRSFAAADAALL